MKRKLQETVNGLLGRWGLALVRRQLPGRPETPVLPPGAEQDLRPDHPFLEELRERYRRFGAFDHSQWNENFVRSEVDLTSFRSDNAYVWQRRRDQGDAHYLLAAMYAERHCREIYSRLDEDGLFGVFALDFDGRLISRDLLDSVLEIDFLNRHLGVLDREDPQVLDIGAGYGRLAYRLSRSLHQRARIFCADGIPESTFLCDYYLRFREVGQTARAVPLDEVEALLAEQKIHLAINIHSFSECPLDAVTWWLDRLERHRVRHLFFVPNRSWVPFGPGAVHPGQELPLSVERGGVRKEILPEIAGRGFELTACEPKFNFSPTLQRCALFPTTYYLFEKRT